MEMERIETLRGAAEKGEAEAQYQLAMLYIYGNGVEEDNTLAAQLLEKAAEQGHVEATYHLGICCHYGHGVEVNLKRACMLYWTSAQCGYGKGMVLTARFYAEGIAVEQNDDEAVKWYKKATESGDVDAAADAWNALSAMCRAGRGMEKDEKQAMKYLELAHNVRASTRYVQR